MTNEHPDTEIVFETYGFCATCERYTHHQCTVCAKRAAETRENAPSSAQVDAHTLEALRIKNAQLQEQLDRIIDLTNGPAYQGVVVTASQLAQDIIQIAVEGRE